MGWRDSGTSPIPIPQFLPVPSERCTERTSAPSGGPAPPNRDGALVRSVHLDVYGVPRRSKREKAPQPHGGPRALPPYRLGLRAAARSRTVRSQSPASPMQPPRPPYSRSFRAVKEGQKHRRPGTPPTCPGQIAARQTGPPGWRRARLPFRPVALLAPSPVPQTPIATASRRAVFSLRQRLATTDQDFFWKIAAPEKALLWLPPEFH